MMNVNSWLTTLKHGVGLDVNKKFNLCRKLADLGVNFDEISLAKN